MMLRKARRILGKYIPALSPEWLDADTSGRTRAYVFGINAWKRKYIARCYPEFVMRFVRARRVPWSVARNVSSGTPTVFIVWGYRVSESVVKFAELHGIPLYRMEDGFVRSVGLGAAHTLPRSLVLDRSGRLYFDATGPTDLERVCESYDFSADPNVLKEAQACLTLLTQEKISKYNHVAIRESPEQIFAQLAPRIPGKKRILVIGQVEDDASLKQGSASHLSNFLAVQVAVAENPGAQVLFKPHPDDLGGHTKRRPKKSTLEEIARLATVIAAPLSVPDAFGCVDHVYTLTSLAGFEALLRGMPVTVLGYPFYAGWGLTDDRQSNPRRTRKLTLLELFAAAYLIYPQYFDPQSGTRSSARETILAISRDRAALHTDTKLPNRKKL